MISNDWVDLWHSFTQYQIYTSKCLSRYAYSLSVTKTYHHTFVCHLPNDSLSHTSMSSSQPCLYMSEHNHLFLQHIHQCLYIHDYFQLSHTQSHKSRSSYQLYLCMSEHNHLYLQYIHQYL